MTVLAEAVTGPNQTLTRWLDIRARLPQTRHKDRRAAQMKPNRALCIYYDSQCDLMHRAISFFAYFSRRFPSLTLEGLIERRA